MKSYILILITFLIVFNSFSQNKTYKAEEIKINNLIDGLLLVPENEETSTLAILIQGSGPTDRNGNQPMVNNNSLK